MATDKCITIPLTKGYTTVIDEVDGDLAQYKWCTSLMNGYRPYAARHIRDAAKKYPLVFIHRIVLERILERPLTKGEYPDHMDNDPLNNRRNNLRLASKSQNQMNHALRKDNTTGYKGVVYHRNANRWTAEIQVNKKKIYLGCFKSPELAYEAYCKAAKEYHGEFARLE